MRISRIRLSRRCRRRHAQPKGHCLAFWPSVYLLPAMVRLKRCRPRHLPLVGIAANRFASRLILRLFCKAPSLHRHYPASSLLRASPPPSGPLTVMDSRFALVPHRPGGLPRFLDRSLRTRRLQPPRGSGPVLADCFPDRAGFILVGGLADPTSLTRPNRVCLRCGSCVRPHEASTLRVSPTAARGLHV